MPPREPGDAPDPAAELLGRWKDHHHGRPDPAGPGAPAGRVPRPKHAGRPAPSGSADQTAAGREVVEALGIPAPPRPAPAPEPAPAPAPSTAAGRVEPGRSTDVEFAPRVLVRRLLGLLLLLLLATTAVAAYLAYDDPTTSTVGVAGTLLVLTLLVHAIRVSANPAHLSIRSGQLEVVRGNRRDAFDLTSRFTRIEVVGRPGRPGWKVLMARFGRDPLVIDSSMVDPVRFTEALERHRPHQP